MRSFSGISIHEALASLDVVSLQRFHPVIISIHEALASLDTSWDSIRFSFCPFRSTRLSRASTVDGDIRVTLNIFRSTRLSRASTGYDNAVQMTDDISIHEALASLDARQQKLH